MISGIFSKLFKRIKGENKQQIKYVAKQQQKPKIKPQVKVEKQERKCKNDGSQRGRAFYLRMLRGRARELVRQNMHRKLRGLPLWN